MCSSEICSAKDAGWDGPNNPADTRIFVSNITLISFLPELAARLRPEFLADFNRNRNLAFGRLLGRVHMHTLLTFFTPLPIRYFFT